MDSSDSKTADPPDFPRKPSSSEQSVDHELPEKNRDERKTQSLFSPTSQAERQRVGKRLLYALPVALVLLGLIMLFGPSAEDIERRFTFYGKEGPLQIMHEIAIDDGLHEVHQQIRPRATPTPGAPDYQIIPEDPLPQESTPPPREAEILTSQTDQIETPDAQENDSLAEYGQGEGIAELLMPTQYADSDFIIRKLVRPLYPANVSVVDQQRPVVVVEAAFYLDENGNIVAVMINSNDGGPEFGEAARNAMQQWEFEPRWRDGKPPAPRWLVLTWRFRSPFRDMID